MNQEERERFFKKEEASLRGLMEKSPSFKFTPHGNHKRSFVGESWYYFGETDIEYTLFHDLVEYEDDKHVYISIYKDNKKISNTSIAVLKDDFERQYPVQRLFPHSMNEEEATAILKEYFINQNKERSTTIETQGE